MSARPFWIASSFADAFADLHFPPVPAGPITVVYPLVFGKVDAKSNTAANDSHSYSDDIPANPGRAGRAARIARAQFFDELRTQGTSA